MNKKTTIDGPIYDARQLGTPKMLLLGLQHMFAMFGATVLVPALTGLDVATALLFAGIGTLLFHLLTGGKVPAFLGSSFAFIGGYNAIRTIGAAADGSPIYDNALLPYACFGVLIAGLMYVILSVLFKTFGVKKVMRFFPPIVTGPIIIAIGLILAMAKGMVDSGYQPENDILFVCHGAEEWGALGTQYDWTTGAWEMIHTAHPEWAGKTIAMLNFELPGTYDGAQQWQISCVPEFANLVAAMSGEDGVFTQPVNGVYPQGLDPVSVDTNTQEDGISYRWHGVPYFIDMPGFENGWTEARYHTLADDRDTYSPDVMQTNLNNFGALAIYLDKTPALALDLTLTCDDLEEALNEDLAAVAGADSAAYLAAVGQLRTAAETLNGKIADVNARYESAAAADASQEELDAMVAEKITVTASHRIETGA